MIQMMQKREINENDVVITTTEARPANKTNEIWSTNIDGITFICERPFYFHENLNIELYQKSFKAESRLIYGKELPFFFDQKGRWWMHEDLCSQKLMNFFIGNPLQYVYAATHKTNAIRNFMPLLYEIEKNLDLPDKLASNFEALSKIFVDFYSYHFITYILFDELLLYFHNLLKSVLPKSLANIYICGFLQAEITKEAIKHGAILEFQDKDRSITYSKTKPIVFHKEQKFFFDSQHDNEVLRHFYEKAPDKVADLLALRLIIPIAVQLSEEGQYLESKALSPMMNILLDNIKTLFVDKGIIENNESLQRFYTDEIIQNLKRNSNDYSIDEKQIQQFLDSFYNSVGKHMDIGTIQPFDWYQFHPLFSKEWCTKLLQTIKNLENKNNKEIASTIDFVSSNREHLAYEILDMKCANLSQEDRKKIVNFRFNICKEKSKKDIFGFKSNITMDTIQLKKLMSKIPFSKATPESARTLGMLYNALYNYGPAISLDFYLGFITENEGPYDISDIFGEGHILVIKKFWNLKPTEIFPHTSNYPYNSITIYCVYKNITYTSDFIACHSQYKGDTLQGLTCFAVQADEHFIDFQPVKNLIEIYSQAAVESWQMLKQLDFESLKQKGLELRSYYQRKLFELAGLDWKPSLEMREAVRGKKLIDKNFWNIPEHPEEIEIYFKDLYHPFNTFNPNVY